MRGQVQGVGFRWFVHHVAAGGRLDGWVANCADGSVEIVAEGPRPELDGLLAALHEGPPSASVSEVESRWLPASGIPAGFRMRSGSHSGD